MAELLFHSFMTGLFSIFTYRLNQYSYSSNSNMCHRGNIDPSCTGEILLFISVPSQYGGITMDFSSPIGQNDIS